MDELVERVAAAIDPSAFARDHYYDSVARKHLRGVAKDQAWAAIGVLTVEDRKSLIERDGQWRVVPVEQQYSYGHCREKKKPGGCQLHNLHCGYPNCDRRKVRRRASPQSKEPT